MVILSYDNLNILEEKLPGVFYVDSEKQYYYVLSRQGIVEGCLGRITGVGFREFVQSCRKLSPFELFKFLKNNIDSNDRDVKFVLSKLEDNDIYLDIFSRR